MDHPQQKRNTPALLAVTSASLFAMFFGAGNLVFPPMLGALSGESFPPAIMGFLASAVALPVVAVMAVAITGHDIRDLTARGGRIFGVLFPVLVYLSIGAFYALPRTAAVSFSASVPPLTGWDSWLAKALFSAVFFGVTYLLAFDPHGIVDKIGRYLTPALVALMVLLVVLSVLLMRPQPTPPTPEYAEGPFISGFLQGYLTMDSLAALALGIIVVASLKHAGVPAGRPLVRGVMAAGSIAGLMLAAVYVGLAAIGRRLPDAQSHSDGASLLSAAAHHTMGFAGIVVFALIVLFACLTTSVGLLGATSAFFARLVPAVSYRRWAIGFSVISFLVSTLGLDLVIAIAAPVIGFLYPTAITLIALTLIEPMLRRRLNLTFVFALAVSLVWSALMTLTSLGWGSAVIDPMITWSPGHAQELGWVVPTLMAAVAGFIVDVVRDERTPEPVRQPET